MYVHKYTTWNTVSSLHIMLSNSSGQSPYQLKKFSVNSMRLSQSSGNNCWTKCGYHWLKQILQQNFGDRITCEGTFTSTWTRWLLWASYEHLINSCNVFWSSQSGWSSGCPCISSTTCYFWWQFLIVSRSDVAWIPLRPSTTFALEQQISRPHSELQF